MRLLVHIQERFKHKILAANTARKRPLDPMRFLNVHSQRAPLRVIFIAKFARKPPLFRVHDRVNREQRLRAERFTASAASERLIAAVQPHVVPQRRNASDPFTAHFAHVHLVHMIHALMLPQGRRLRERLVALIAVVARLHVARLVRFLVPSQVALVVKSFIARVAF